MVIVCEKCGCNKLKKSKSGLSIVCCSCGFCKQYDSKETVKKIINYKPTPKEKLIDFIAKNSEYICEYGYVGDYIEIEKLLEGIDEIL